MKKWILLAALVLPFLTRAQKPEITVSTGHTSAIDVIVLSDDSKWLATGGNDKNIKIIDMATEKEFRAFPGNDGRPSHMAFSQGTKYIASVFSDETLKVWEVGSGKEVLKKEEVDENADIVFTSSDEIIYMHDKGRMVRMDLQGNVKAEYGEYGYFSFAYQDEVLIGYDYKGVMRRFSMDGAELSSRQLFEKFVYSPCTMKISPDGKTLAAVFNENEIHLIDMKDLSVIKTMKGNAGRIFSMDWDDHGDMLFTTEHTGYVNAWDTKSGKSVHAIKPMVFASNSLTDYPGKNRILVAENSRIHLLNVATGEKEKTIISKGNRLMNMAYNGTGKYLAVSSLDMKVKIWDLEFNKITREVMGFWPMAFHPSKDRFVCSSMATILSEVDILTGKPTLTFEPSGDLLQNISYSKDGKYLAGAGFKGEIAIWQAETGKLITKLTGHKGGVYGTAFSPDGKLLASAGMDQTVIVWDLEKRSMIKQLEGHQIIVSDVVFSPDGSKLYSSAWDKTIKVWNTSDWTQVGELTGHTNMIIDIDIDPSGKYLASCAGNNSVWSADNSIIIWDLNTMNEKCRLKGHAGTINRAMFADNGSRIFSCADDGMLKFWDVGKCEEVATFISVGMKDYVIVAPDNYYSASKEGLSAVSFRYNGKLYPFEQFDVVLNRPDILASRIGKTNESLVNAMNYVYKKRLRSMNLKEEQLSADFHLPEIFITKKPDLIVPGDNVKFSILGKDSLYFLDRILVYVNNVPLKGETGVSVIDKKVHSVTYDLDVKLLPGKNKIEVAMMNEKGVKSLSEVMLVSSEMAPVAGDLYVVTMGVSRYANEKFNLKYPVKDATDIANKLKENKVGYSSVKILELHDEKVTRAAIDGVKDFIAPAKETDAVIIYLAGHGVLDENLNYYYAAYDMDFNDPGAKGIPYEDIEGIQYAIKAYKKLLIFDTCHSGELDREEIEKSSQDALEVGEIKFRSAGQGVRTKEGLGLENSWHLMETMFSDVRKGTGATVIAGAGGAEFAMESSEWNNGLFTYCLLRGLSGAAADLNGTGGIEISELKKYVYDQVSELSDGKQRPTSRVFNETMDFRLK